MAKRKKEKSSHRPRPSDRVAKSKNTLTPEVLGPEEPHSGEPDPGVVDPIEAGQVEVIEDFEGGETISAAQEPAVETGSAEQGVIVPRDALQRYYADIRRSKPLSREKEKQLAIKYQEHGDLDAAYALVTANLRLVVKIAMEYQSVYINLLDLIQEGNIGLMQAVKRYNPYRGVKLSTYAAWWIRAFILRYIINNFRLVKIGTTRAQRKLFFNLNKERQRLEAMGYDASPRLIASHLDVTEKEVEEMSARMGSPDASLDQPIGVDGKSSILDFLPDKAPGPDVIVEREQTKQRALQILGEISESLPERERVILESRLLADEPATLEQIGDQFGITKERTRQLEKRLLERLRETLRERLFAPPPVLPASESPDRETK